MVGTFVQLVVQPKSWGNLHVHDHASNFSDVNKIIESIWLHSWHFYHNHATKVLLQKQMCRIKETPTISLLNGEMRY